MNLTLFWDFLFEVFKISIYLSLFFAMFFSAGPGFDLQKTTSWQTVSSLSTKYFPTIVMAWKKKTIGEISYGPHNIHFLPGMRCSEGKTKEKKSKCLLKLRTECPGGGQRRSVLWVVMDAKHCLGSGSQAASPGTEEHRLELVLSQFQTDSKYQTHSKYPTLLCHCLT